MFPTTYEELDIEVWHRLDGLWISTGVSEKLWAHLKYRGLLARFALDPQHHKNINAYHHLKYLFLFPYRRGKRERSVTARITEYILAYKAMA